MPEPTNGASRTRTVLLGDAWKARRDDGLPCWCGEAIGHVGWPTCADEHLPRCGDCAVPGPEEIEHGVLLCCNLPLATSDTEAPPVPVEDLSRELRAGTSGADANDATSSGSSDSGTPGGDQ